MEVFVGLVHLDVVSTQHLDCFLVAVEVTVATLMMVLMVVLMETCCHHHQILVSCL
jgi:hypothetical protein